jgi:hypothetical protein
MRVIVGNSDTSLGKTLVNELATVLLGECLSIRLHALAVVRATPEDGAVRGRPELGTDVLCDIDCLCELKFLVGQGRARVQARFSVVGDGSSLRDGDEEGEDHGKVCREQHDESGDMGLQKIVYVKADQQLDDSFPDLIGKLSFLNKGFSWEIK